MTNDPMRLAARLRPGRDGWSAEHSLDAQKGTTAQDSATKPTRRRRHDYSPEIADLICDRIAEGASLRQICQDANMPAKSTIFVWLEEHEDFARSYALARQIQIEDLMDEILEMFRAKRTGNRAGSTLRSDASKADLRREVPALRCPAVTCNVS
jgi:hypothetical protein